MGGLDTEDRSSEERLVELIRRAQRYDTKAFEQLYILYANKIYQYIRYRVKDRELAEDLTADIFLRLLESIRSFRIGPTDQEAIFSGWLFRIAHNVVIDYYKDRARREQLPLDEPMVDEQNYLAAVERGLSEEQLVTAIAQLTDDQQQVVILKFFEGMSNKEVGRIIGKSEGAVKSLQHRALAALQRILARERGGGQ